MPSVTEVLGYSTPPQLVNWFKKNSEAKCNKIADETARIGQAVDLLVQQDIREGGYLTPEDSPEALNCLAGWERFKKDYPCFVSSVKAMQTELVNGELIGHPDFECEEETGWGITDLKCTSGIRDKNWIQMAKYAAMIMKIRGWNFPSFLRVIRLQRTCDIAEVVEIREPRIIQYCMDLFESYYAIFKSEREFKEFIRTQLEDQLLGGF